MIWDYGKNEWWQMMDNMIGIHGILNKDCEYYTDNGYVDGKGVWKNKWMAKIDYIHVQIVKYMYQEDATIKNKQLWSCGVKY